MRVRALSPEGDMQYGLGRNAWLVDSPMAVGQIISTRLKLWTKEWFLDTTAGTDYLPGVFSSVSDTEAKEVIINRILSTVGVNSVINVAYQLDKKSRKISISADVNTTYGQTVFVENI